MDTTLAFDKILNKARQDEAFAGALLEAAASSSPIVAFCRVCGQAGIEIYPMDIADADESAYASMRRSTNGGGENSPHLNWDEGIFDGLIRELNGMITP